ncbi:hypothetical protein [Massilia genomosp. 1]|uniref:Lipoprotein n=1 Tax=Massilia genomosp. 1 TaxID=2609280 RepID=A0ABX0MML6_9BURK|nr:hypothetical protein [Massilia genomosp. 1]NHZ61263.1 hypothetical protein [Massilia genomosp. 1]
MKLVQHRSSLLRSPRGVLPALAIMGVLLSASGCFTAFTPKREFCTGDPKDTSLPLCKPKAPQ